MSTAGRRLRSIPAVLVAALLLLVLLPVWLPLAALVDALRGKFRLPAARLLLFGLCWTWLETIGIVVSFWLWATRRAWNLQAHYRLQRWWAANLMRSLQFTTGFRVEATEARCLTPGPAIMLCRHASLADSLLSAWVVTSVVRMNPRYVLKRELMLDPCLDIVGNRLPNHFLDRDAADSSVELDALRTLSMNMAPDEIAIIFPEGTRATPAKRDRALEKLRERDPQRAARLEGLRHVLPPRPAGSAALVEGHGAADVVFAWHVGFDGLDNFGAILRHLERTPRPVQFHARRVARVAVPSGEAFTQWLDEQWALVDNDVAELLRTKGNQ
jgi:1-acyl-sn-glycerol-3-phosphate acyltransferase